MNILALCAALDKSYLALFSDNKITDKIIKSDEKNYHSLYLIKSLNEILKKNNITLNDLDLITTNIGPGSFTGIRVALSIAKTISAELNIPCVPLNTAQILLNTYNKKYLLLDARRDMFFISQKQDEGERFSVSEIKLIYKNELEKYIKKEQFDEILCDLNSLKYVKGALCYENENKNIAITMISLAKEKYQNSKNKDEFNFMNLKANYIQTPPVFGLKG